MRVPHFIIALSCAGWLSACHQKKADTGDVIEYRDVVITSMESEPPPPPPPPPPPTKSQRPRFPSIRDWLIHLSRTEKPPKAGLIYHFSLSQGKPPGMLFVHGYLNRQSNKPDDTPYVHFYPKEMYYPLPETYTDLSKEEIQKQISAQLTEFTGSEKFQSTFFADASIIGTDWQLIWTKFPKK